MSQPIPPSLTYFRANGMDFHLENDDEGIQLRSVYYIGRALNMILEERESKGKPEFKFTTARSSHHHDDLQSAGLLS